MFLISRLCNCLTSRPPGVKGFLESDLKWSLTNTQIHTATEVKKLKSYCTHTHRDTHEEFPSFSFRSIPETSLNPPIMQFPFLPRWVSLSELLHFSQNKWVWNIPTMDDSSPQWNYDYLCVVSLFIKAFSHLLQPHPGNLFLSPSCFHLYTEILTVSLVFIYPLFRYTESSASRPIGRQREWSSYTEHSDTQQQAHLPASEPPSIYGISIIPPLYFLLLFPFIFTLLFPLWLSKVKKKPSTNNNNNKKLQQYKPASLFVSALSGHLSFPFLILLCLHRPSHRSSRAFLTSLKAWMSNSGSRAGRQQYNNLLIHAHTIYVNILKKCLSIYL